MNEKYNTGYHIGQEKTDALAVLIKRKIMLKYAT